MAPLFLVILATFPVFAVPEYKDLVQYREKSHIIGGVSADIEEFPFLVALIYTWTFFGIPTVKQRCGGTIITEDWVLTAAHCLVPNVTLPIDVPIRDELTHVRAGSSYADRGGILRGVVGTVSHNHPPHDIALVKVDERWPFNGVTISPARLPRQDDPVPVRSPATIMGWGKTDLQGTLPEVLMKSEVVVISPDYCATIATFWNVDVVNDTQMCTLFSPAKTPSHLWKGDSGSPVVVNGEVVGIASQSYPNYMASNIHTRVSSYIDWIEENVGPLPRAKW